MIQALAAIELIAYGGDWQTDHDLATCVHRALNVDRATQALDDFAAGHQAQPQTFKLARGAQFGKDFEKSLGLLGPEAHPVVANAETTGRLIRA